MSLESLVRRDRLIVAAGLVGVTVLAWVYLVHMAREMGDAAAMAAMPGMPAEDPPGLRELALAFLMWAVMMVGMMLPSAAPMVLVFAGINRHRGAAGGPVVPTGAFVSGYLLIWTAFSVAAALGQWALQRLAVVSAHALIATPLLGGAILLGAGVYQLTPLKYACLARCRSPLGFILEEWREGARGAVVMGIRHGIFCVGCCWVLMALLFVAGVMNLAWVAAIAAFVLVEKLLPAGRVVSRAAGGVLIGWGLWTLAQVLR